MLPADGAALTGPRPRSDEAGSVTDPPPVLDVTIPVHNEERDLEPCVRRLHQHLVETFPYPFRITIADNASTDRTAQVAVWSASPAPVLAYLDVDLSTDLGTWPPGPCRWPRSAANWAGRPVPGSPAS